MLDHSGATKEREKYREWKTMERERERVDERERNREWYIYQSIIYNQSIYKSSIYIYQYINIYQYIINI